MALGRHDGEKLEINMQFSADSTYNMDVGDAKELNAFHAGEKRKIITEADDKPRLSVSDGKTTLAEIKKRARQDNEEKQETNQFHKISVQSFTSEDASNLKRSKLYTYYCSVCGSLNIVADGNLFSMKRRKTDHAIALSESEFTHKKYTKTGEKVHIKRKGGVEVQHRHNCKECGLIIGYRPKPEAEPAQFSYFFADALVKDQGESAAMKYA